VAPDELLPLDELEPLLEELEAPEDEPLLPEELELLPLEEPPDDEPLEDELPEEDELPDDEPPELEEDELLLPGGGAARMAPGSLMVPFARPSASPVPPSVSVTVSVVPLMVAPARAEQLPLIHFS
jgi:hypothetical protein